MTEKESKIYDILHDCKTDDITIHEAIELIEKLYNPSKCNANKIVGWGMMNKKGEIISYNEFKK
jgi:hypothetical protein